MHLALRTPWVKQEITVVFLIWNLCKNVSGGKDIFRGRSWAHLQIPFSSRLEKQNSTKRIHTLQHSYDAMPTKYDDSYVTGHHVDSGDSYGGQKQVEIAVVSPGYTVPNLRAHICIDQRVSCVYRFALPLFWDHIDDTWMYVCSGPTSKCVNLGLIPYCGSRFAHN